MTGFRRGRNPRLGGREAFGVTDTASSRSPSRSPASFSKKPHALQAMTPQIHFPVSNESKKESK